MDFNANLIDKVSSCEPIYNQYHPDHKNRVVLENLWTSIAASLDSTGSLSGNSYVFISIRFRWIENYIAADRCKTRWASLRTTFGKKRRKKMSLPSGSARIAEEEWVYYKQMSFLDPYIRHRQWVTSRLICQ